MSCLMVLLLLMLLLVLLPWGVAHDHSVEYRT